VSGKNSSQLHMRFQHKPSPKLEYSLHNGPWTPVNDHLEKGVKYCPTILLNPSNGKHSLTIKQVIGGNTLVPNILSPKATFIITTQLEILESGSLAKTLKLMQGYGVQDISSLQFEEVEFGPSNLQKMIEALAKGEKDMLNPALHVNPPNQQEGR